MQLRKRSAESAKGGFNCWHWLLYHQWPITTVGCFNSKESHTTAFIKFYILLLSAILFGDVTPLLLYNFVVRGWQTIYIFPDCFFLCLKSLAHFCHALLYWQLLPLLLLRLTQPGLHVVLQIGMAVLYYFLHVTAQGRHMHYVI
jgi:hypothetical protein